MYCRGALSLYFIFGFVLLWDCVLGQTSLYIPGFDPQPVSAEIAGVDSRGRTTWLLHKGTPTTTLIPGPGMDFVGTATLVEGPQDLSFTYANSAAQFSLGQECTFSGQFAICTIVAQGSTATQTEFVSRVEIQGGASVIVTPVSSSSSADSTSTSSRVAASPSLTSSMPEVTSSSSPPPPSSASSINGTQPSQTVSSRSKGKELPLFSVTILLVTQILASTWPTLS